MNKKEEIEKILNQYSIDHHHEGIILQENWFDCAAEDIVKLFSIPDVVFSEAEVCPYCGSEGTIKNDRKHKLCTNCSKGWQT